MTTTDQPTLRVSGPADLAETIPYLLGFHPTRSLVLVGTEAGRVVVTARMDLDDLDDPGGGALLRMTTAGIARGGAERLVAVVFDDTAVVHGAARPNEMAVLPWSGLADDVRAAAAAHALLLDDVALVSRSRLWSFCCTNAACCPPEGRELGGTSVAAAAATFAGMVALPDRAAVEAILAPAPDDERSALRTGIEAVESEAVLACVRGVGERWNRSVVRALFAAARELDGGCAVRLDDSRAVRFGAALRSIQVRDSAWIALDQRRIDGRALWRQLATRLPAPYDAAPLFLFGWASYRDGDGALAGIAAERAIDSDPSYTAADLLSTALAQAVDPRTLPRMRNEPSPARRPAKAARRAARPGAADPTRR